MKNGSETMIKHMEERVLLLNLYVTQAIALVLAGIGIYILYWRNGIQLNSFFRMPSVWDLGWAVFLAGGVIACHLLLAEKAPKEYLDDGGINEKIFSNRPVWHIFVISAVVAFSEELLFRVVIQSQAGLWLTSILFAVIHIRYLRKWLLFNSVLAVSLLIGWLYEYTGSVTGPMICHFLIDFVLGCYLRFRHKTGLNLDREE